MIKFYNTLKRKKEEFIAIKKNEVGIYSCGPTVYDYAHIGNMSTYVFVDLLKRYLAYQGYEVKHVMNITDVDDKTIKRAHNENKSLDSFTEIYTNIFFNDLKLLNINPADIYPKATEHIPDMVSMIRKLMDKGFAYEKDGSIYFKVKNFSSYGKLAQLDKQSLKFGASVMDSDEYTKESVSDFVLWKAYKPEEDGDVFWETGIGKGRPGWHIECSAMSMKYLGDTIDIHTGAVDLKFPHHDNEIAQSEALTGKTFVRYWLHREFLNIDSQKMSKSLKNTTALKDIVKDSLDAVGFRYLIVSSHYRSLINFNHSLLDSAKNTIVNLRYFIQDLVLVDKKGKSQVGDLIKNTRENFIEEMNNDLSTPTAIAHIFNMVKDIEKLLKNKTVTSRSANDVIAFLKEIDQVLGVIFFDFSSSKEELPDRVVNLVKKREKARKDKNWKHSDELRDNIFDEGYLIEDAVNGQQIKKKI